MKILLTGASGFIGRHLLMNLPKEWEIVALYRNPEFLNFVERNSLTNVKPFFCELTEIDSLEWLKNSDVNYELCIYLASLVDLPGSVNLPIKDLNVNLIGLINLLENISCDRFVFMSSGAVYDGLKNEVSPEMKLCPRLPYAINKLASEYYVNYYFHHRKKIGSYVVLRFMGAYGVYEKPNKIFTKMLKSFVLGNENQYKIYGDGTNLIDAMYIDDCIKGLLSVVNSDNKKSVVVDFGYGTPVSITELVETTAKIFEKKISITHEGQTSEPIGFRINPSKMADLFGFRPTITYSKGIVDFASKLKLEDRGTS